MSTLRFIQNFDDSMTQESVIPETLSFTDRVVADSFDFHPLQPTTSLRDMLHGTGVSLTASSAPIVSQPNQSNQAVSPRCTHTAIVNSMQDSIRF
jgi:hypothetical protein